MRGIHGTPNRAHNYAQARICGEFRANLPLNGFRFTGSPVPHLRIIHGKPTPCVEFTAVRCLRITPRKSHRRCEFRASWLPDGCCVLHLTRCDSAVYA
jgi:hypothetical protein